MFEEIVIGNSMSNMLQCLSHELKKVRPVSHQAEKGETCLTKLRHMGSRFHI